MTYEARLKVARLLFLIAEKDLRQRYCSCRAPVERFVDAAIDEAMRDVERALAETTEP